MAQILLVEDNEQLARFTRRVLTLEGHHVDHCATAAAALAVPLDASYDLVLLDLRLPDQDGWVVLERLQGNAESAAIPVVVLTASAASDEQARALAMGARAYLIKPLSADTLVEAVARYTSQPA